MLQTDYKHLHLTTIIIITTARECYSPSCNLRPMRLRFDFGVWFNLFTMQFFLCNKLLWLVSPVLRILKPIALFPYCSAFTRPYQWCLLWCGYDAGWLTMSYATESCCENAMHSWSHIFLKAQWPLALCSVNMGTSCFLPFVCRF